MRARIGIHDCIVRAHSNGLYTVKARIYGQRQTENQQQARELELILDTGASYIAVKSRAFDIINPKDVTTTSIAGVSGTEETRKGLVDVVVDGALRVENAEIVEAPNFPYNRVSGLLGMTFLQHFGLYFDVNIQRPIRAGGRDYPMFRFHYFSEDNHELPLEENE